MQLFGNEVDGRGDRGLSLFLFVGIDRLQQIVKESQQVLLMDATGAARGLKVDLLAEEREAEGIALAVQQFYQNGSCVDAKGDFVGVVDIAMPFGGEEHGAALVYYEMAPQVGLFLELFNIEAVGTAIEVPVDVFRTLAGVVLAIVGEFDRETVERTFMPAGDETFHHLAGIKVQRFVTGNLLLIHEIG